ncbi:MAG: hypothetical protein MUF14_00350 [Hyphomonadaceae bacterium]|jgi:hypothetical protein|nr:hypothetical protein [Hyphomonadaceae bacterium]
MSVKKMMLAGATLAAMAMAAPAFAQVTLSTDPTNASAAVTTSITPACALTGTLAPFAVTVTPQGVATATGGTQSVTVTCNTRDANLTVGSNDMVNTTAPAIVETSTFTNTIAFNANAQGEIAGDSIGWALDSKPGGQSGIGTIGGATNRRIRELRFDIRNVAPQGGLLPVAGAYAGTMCLTVSPVGTMTGTQIQDGNNTCTSAGAVGFTPLGPVVGTGNSTTAP